LFLRADRIALKGVLNRVLKNFKTTLKGVSIIFKGLSEPFKGLLKAFQSILKASMLFEDLYVVNKGLKGGLQGIIRGHKRATRGYKGVIREAIRIYKGL